MVSTAEIDHRRKKEILVVGSKSMTSKNIQKKKNL